MQQSAVADPIQAQAAPDHFVQLYRNDEVLTRTVTQYLVEGLKQGESGLVIAAAPHRTAFRQGIESRNVDCAAAEQNGKVLFLDAEQTLARFLVNGRPDWDRFHSVISKAVENLRSGGSVRVRAYGEMVGMLWTTGQYSAAVRVEEYWNRILCDLQATLFCSYPIDVFGPEFNPCAVHAILCDHTRMLPSIENESLDRCIRDATLEVVGDAYRTRMLTGSLLEQEWGEIPRTERTILWLRQNFPESANEILQRAQDRHRNDISQHDSGAASI